MYNYTIIINGKIIKKLLLPLYSFEQLTIISHLFPNTNIREEKSWTNGTNHPIYLCCLYVFTSHSRLALANDYAH